MKQLKAVISKEFSGYFKNYTAYIVMAVYLLLTFAATFYSAYFFEYNNQNLVSFFIYQPVILNLLVPALTMKLWAEERKLGTLEFLLTQPISYTTLVWGKFLAAFGFSVIILLMTVPFVCFCAFLIDLDILNVMSGYIALILTVGSLCALGCVVSAINGNVIIAYLSSLFCGWIFLNADFDFLVLPAKKIFPLLNTRLNNILNFDEYYQTFIEGQMALSAAAYYCCFILLMLWLNILIVKWHKA
jgi:ABC-2 type transport system permease protein